MVTMMTATRGLIDIEMKNTWTWGATRLIMPSAMSVRKVARMSRRGEGEGDLQQVREEADDQLEEGHWPMLKRGKRSSGHDGEALGERLDDQVVAVEREEEHHRQLHLEAGEERHLLAELRHVELGLLVPDIVSIDVAGHAAPPRTPC